ncbi:unnamed protein product [Leptidea sinapis]|uniref:Uncharacterized protein n=1 Tax=Leptidea sinapis TaxID=189913 RepID=A0A5E4QZF9_9NEOP|nr:unnamed protein product [Leptidea sinapis]
MEKEIEYLENLKRKNNLIFFGVKEYSTQNAYDKLCNAIKSSIIKEWKTNTRDISTLSMNLLDKRAVLIRKENKTKSDRTEIACLSKQIRKNIRKDKQVQRLRSFEKYIVQTGGIKKAVRKLADKKKWIPKLTDKKGYIKTKRRDLIAIATDFYHNLLPKDACMSSINHQERYDYHLNISLLRILSYEYNDLSRDFINNSKCITLGTTYRRHADNSRTNPSACDVIIYLLISQKV